MVAVISGAGNFCELSTDEDDERKEGDVERQIKAMRVYQGKSRKKRSRKRCHWVSKHNEFLTEEKAKIYAKEFRKARLRNELEEKAYERCHEGFLYVVKGVVDLNNVYTCLCDEYTNSSQLSSSGFSLELLIVCWIIIYILM